MQDLSEGYIVELRFVLDAPMVYETTNVVEFGAADAVFNLSNGQLRVRPHSRENSVALIRSRVEPVLRGWEFQETLVFGFAPPRFAFVNAEIVGDITSVQLDAPDKLLHDDPQVGEIQITVNHFSTPPQVRVTPELFAAWQRWQRAKIGTGESMQSAAYFVLTVLEQLAGGRQEAAKTFAIDLEVLRRMGELASTTGDLSTARKSYDGDGRDLSYKETKWLHSVVRSVLLNAGQVAAGVDPEQMGMSDVGRVR